MKKKDRGSLMEVEKAPENQGEMEKDTLSAEEIQENDEEFKNENIEKKTGISLCQRIMNY